MMRTASLAVAVFVLVGGLAAGQIPSQQQQRPRVEEFSIRGKIITDSARESDLRIEVRLEKSTMQQIQTAYTDGAGNFEFRSLQPGSYTVAINVEGYEPVRQLVDVYSGIGSASISIFLNRADVLRARPTGLDAADPDVIDVSQMRERFPKKAVQSYEKALEEKKKGQPDKAIKLLEESIQLAPTFFHAHNNLGILYQMTKRYDDAEKEYRQARQLNSKNAQPLVNLGSLFIEESGSSKDEGEEAVGKLLDQALDALEEAVKLDSHSALAYYYLGSANYKSSFYPEAEAALKKALDLDPNMGIVRLMLANVYMKQNRWRSVLQNLDAYLEANPKASDRGAIEEMRAKIAQGLEATSR